MLPQSLPRRPPGGQNLQKTLCFSMFFGFPAFSFRWASAASRGPQSGPSRPHMGTTWPQDGPKTAPRWPQEGPRWPQEGAKRASKGGTLIESTLFFGLWLPRGLKEARRRPQEGPKKAPRGPQEGPKSASRGSRCGAVLRVTVAVWPGGDARSAKNVGAPNQPSAATLGLHPKNRGLEVRKVMVHGATHCEITAV